LGSKQTLRTAVLRPFFGAAGVLATLSCGTAVAQSNTLADPPAFTSQNGVLDIMMVAMPQPIPTITYAPPDGSAPIRPGGCIRSARVRPTD
jgi:hypothetical protein